eukprot:3705290-Rhodomonas_salina.2
MELASPYCDGVEECHRSIATCRTWVAVVLTWGYGATRITFAVQVWILVDDATLYRSLCPH